MIAKFGKSIDDEMLRREFDELRSALKGHPRHRENYGIAHNDLHAANFLAQSTSAITIFDTDDCCQQWFASDIAMVLFYGVLFQDDKEAAASAFFPNFWRGYCEENELDPSELERLPPFFRRRAFVLFGVLHERRSSFSDAQRRFYDKTCVLMNPNECSLIDFPGMPK